MTTVDRLCPPWVYYSQNSDGARMTRDWSAASDGTYDSAMNEIRQRAADLGTAPLISEFGNKMTDNRTPWMIRAMYQAMDYGVPGKNWWSAPASGGAVLSSLQWQWDIYSGRHHELMNGNPGKVQTDGDGWNDEDHSVVATDDAGTVTLRLDQRVLDRLYPSAVNGDTLAFAFEDLARSGYGGAGTQQAWLTVPSSMPDVAALVQNRQYGILVWRSSGTSAPTELHLPSAFSPSGTAVVSDLATLNGVPASGPIAAATETGSSTAKKLRITAQDNAVHFALVVNTATGTPPTNTQLNAARTALTTWLTDEFPAAN
jgi:hypothetical protein